MQLLSDFRRDLPDGKSFSSKEHGVIVIESAGKAKGGQKDPSLILSRHVEFLQSVLKHDGSRNCAFIVEQPSKHAKSELAQVFNSLNEVDGALCTQIECNNAFIDRFLKIGWKNYDTEPWENEQGWIVAGLRKELPSPRSDGPPWSLDHLLLNIDCVDSIFAQFGWFALLLFKPFPHWESRIEKEFDLQVRP